MRDTTISIIILVVVILGGAYLIKSYQAPETNTLETSQMPITSGENPQPGSTVHDLPVEPAAARARLDLATKLSVDEGSIVIIKITEETWSDGCLGLGGPAEACLQALVPGFRVEMLANGKTYFYRTDKTGEVLRLETQ